MEQQDRLTVLLAEYQECWRVMERHSDEPWRTANIWVIAAFTGAAWTLGQKNDSVTVWAAVVAIVILWFCFRYLRRLAGLTLVNHKRVHQIQTELGMKSSLYVHAVDHREKALGELPQGIRQEMDEFASRFHRENKWQGPVGFTMLKVMTGAAIATWAVLFLTSLYRLLCLNIN